MSGYEASVRTQLILPNGTTPLDITDLDSFIGILFTYRICYNNGTNGTSNTWPDIAIARICGYQTFDPTFGASYCIDFDTDGRLPSNHSSRLIAPEDYNCVAEHDIYQWGCSGEWILITASVNSFWLFGLWILWLDAELCSQSCKNGRRMGQYRAMIDLSRAITEELGNDLGAYSEQELDKTLGKKGPIKYFVTEGKGTEESGLI